MMPADNDEYIIYYFISQASLYTLKNQVGKIVSTLCACCVYVFTKATSAVSVFHKVLGVLYQLRTFGRLPQRGII